MIVGISKQIERTRYKIEGVQAHILKKKRDENKKYNNEQ